MKIKIGPASMSGIASAINVAKDHFDPALRSRKALEASAPTLQLMSTIRDMIDFKNSLELHGLRKKEIEDTLAGRQRELDAGKATTDYIKSLLEPEAGTKTVDYFKVKPKTGEMWSVQADPEGTFKFDGKAFKPLAPDESKAGFYYAKKTNKSEDYKAPGKYSGTETGDTLMALINADPSGKAAAEYLTKLQLNEQEMNLLLGKEQVINELKTESAIKETAADKAAREEILQVQYGLQDVNASKANARSVAGQKSVIDHRVKVEKANPSQKAGAAGVTEKLGKAKADLGALEGELMEIQSASKQPGNKTWNKTNQSWETSVSYKGKDYSKSQLNSLITSKEREIKKKHAEINAIESAHGRPVTKFGKGKPKAAAKPKPKPGAGESTLMGF